MKIQIGSPVRRTMYYVQTKHVATGTTNRNSNTGGFSAASPSRTGWGNHPHSGGLALSITLALLGRARVTICAIAEALAVAVIGSRALRCARASVNLVVGVDATLGATGAGPLRG